MKLRSNTRFYSEHGEDHWLANAGHVPKTGYYVDVGAAHPFVNSNTALLRDMPGWNGLAIDGDRRWSPYWRTHFMHRVLAANHDAVRWDQNEANPFNSAITQGDTETSELVAPATLEEAMAGHRVEHIDLLSLDVNGYEALVLSAFDWARHQPDVLIVRYGRPDRVLESLAELGQYQLAATTASNFIYIRRQ